MKWEYTELSVVYDPPVRFYVDHQMNGAVTGSSLVEVLNRLGEQGWELVAVNDRLFYFKRAK